MLSSAWLIPIVPLGTFVINIFFGKRLKGASAYISILAIGFGFLYSLGILFRVFGGERLDASLLWVPLAGEMRLGVGLLIDELAAVMLLVVTSVSLMVHIYSVGYMHGDIRYSRFYAYLSLFSAAMLGLVLANSYALLFVCWELVGLTSYLLIGFWFEKKEAANAGKKAFITTKLGDIGMFIGILVLLANVGSLGFKEVFHFAQAGEMSVGLITVASLLLFCGAVGKSAQFPLHVWLPDAMEGPTPVSALIHAATMVAAGVYLVARSFPLFALSPAALEVVATIGIITAFLAASIALVQNDIKRILAYSTISQLGFMMTALGVGGYTAGIFHLFTHAFFKALLFLGAGSVIHAAHINDIRQMGGLFKKMPITGWTFLLACLSIAGVPPLAGFWSKDEIFLEALRTGHTVILVVGLLTACMTAFYMFRLFFITFTGKYRGDHPIHESPWVMTLPLALLGFMAVFAGLPGSPLMGNGFHHFVHFEEGGVKPSGMVMALSILAGLVGIFLAWLLYYRQAWDPRKLINAAPGAYRFLLNKWYFDEVYQVGVVRPVLGLSRVLAWIDLRGVDGGVNGVAWVAVLISKIKRLFDIYIVDGLVNLSGAFFMALGQVGRKFQTGLVQNYALVLLFGVVILVLAKLFLGG